MCAIECDHCDQQQERENRFHAAVKRLETWKMRFSIYPPGERYPAYFRKLQLEEGKAEVDRLFKLI